MKGGVKPLSCILKKQPLTFKKTITTPLILHRLNGLTKDLLTNVVYMLRCLVMFSDQVIRKLYIFIQTIIQWGSVVFAYAYRAYREVITKFPTAWRTTSLLFHGRWVIVVALTQNIDVQYQYWQGFHCRLSCYELNMPSNAHLYLIAPRGVMINVHTTNSVQNQQLFVNKQVYSFAIGHWALTIILMNRY